MSRAPIFRGSLWIVVIGWAGASGCIHNHYYGTSIPGCPPPGSTVTTQLGPVCDVPSNSQIVVTGPTTSKTISSNVAPPLSSSATMLANPSSRVVISQPAYGLPSVGQSNSRFKWRKPDPEGLPTMKAEGGLDDSVIR